jgi:hypothetical protein
LSISCLVIGENVQAVCRRRRRYLAIQDIFRGDIVSIGLLVDALVFYKVREPVFGNGKQFCLQ